MTRPSPRQGHQDVRLSECDGCDCLREPSVNKGESAPRQEFHVRSLQLDWLRRVATIPIALVVESGAEISGERTGQTRLPIVNCGRLS
jgi:hypothetical protein